MFHQCILGLSEYGVERLIVQRIQMHQHRQTADELRDQAVVLQVSRADIFEEIFLIHLVLILAFLKSDLCLIQARCDQLVYSLECTSADEEDICCVHFHHLSLRMLSASLWRHENLRTFEQFQHSLLYALAGYIAGDRWIVTLAGDLVDLIDIDDAVFGSFDIIVTYLQQTGQDTLHIFAYIARLGEYRSIHDRKRHIQKLSDGLSEQGFAGTCLADHDDV